jgi:hypothetical protein
MPPIVDIKTRKITGCSTKEEYLHEEGHLKFQETSYGATIQWASEMGILFMLGSLSLSFFIDFFRYISVVLFVFEIFCLVYEELWVGEYAEKELNGKKNKQ